MKQARKSKSEEIEQCANECETHREIFYYLNKFSFNYSPESIQFKHDEHVYLKFRFILQLNRIGLFAFVHVCT